ncbi:YpdA family putative bacillithiol disulfide reductase [Pontibacter cellulosilyticus]|uniref:YpdA family putative bacillithiol disulfide reductase n=1 Tax=Pontibacter cellulosilyticus TaxID=1720253 RepID=A0A923NCR0_9BACT|nr:YpdA family putative bacillithiol disulfide reductase [Pontibacter cellulosilyticus]MBC5994997.1 YpdA family putative bacillithiol disulfide reductase [Pontibacter cellulosilyticus]
MEELLDVLIVGGGPIGLACGIEAKKANLSYTIIEKGCLVNSLFNYPLHMTFFSTADRLEIGGYPFPSIHPKPNRMEALEYYRRVADVSDLNLRLFEEVQSIKPGTDEVYLVSTSKGKYKAKHIIIATGFYDIPNLLNIPGEDLPKVKHYYYDPHFYYKQKIVVVGANNSAADVALETWRRGAEVTMVVREPELQSIKYWVKPDLQNRIDEGSIKAYFSSVLTEVRESEVDILTPQGKVTLANDYVMAMTGYQPNFDFLKSIGIELSLDEKRHPTHNPETMETNMPSMYLAGVVCGGMDTRVWFIENSRIHAVKIVEHILQAAEQEKAF